MWTPLLLGEDRKISSRAPTLTINTVSRKMSNVISGDFVLTWHGTLNSCFIGMTIYYTFPFTSGIGIHWSTRSRLFLQRKPCTGRGWWWWWNHGQYVSDSLWCPVPSNCIFPRVQWSNGEALVSHWRAYEYNKRIHFAYWPSTGTEFKEHTLWCYKKIVNSCNIQFLLIWFHTRFMLYYFLYKFVGFSLLIEKQNKIREFCVVGRISSKHTALANYFFGCEHIF